MNSACRSSIRYVATTFAADTPLAVTGIVARNGIAGNWLWWNFVMSGMMTVSAGIADEYRARSPWGRSRSAREWNLLRSSHRGAVVTLVRKKTVDG